MCPEGICVLTIEVSDTVASESVLGKQILCLPPPFLNFGTISVLCNIV